MAEPTEDAAASVRATLRCRHCGAGNRVPVARALRDLQAVRCGRCNLALLRVHGERDFLQVLAGAHAQRLGREGGREGESDGPIEAPR